VVGATSSEGALKQHTHNMIRIQPIFTIVRWSSVVTDVDICQ